MLRSGMNTSLIEDHLTGQEVALMSRAKSNLADICATWIELMTNEDGEGDVAEKRGPRPGEKHLVRGRE
jgi:hypothetical protein